MKLLGIALRANDSIKGIQVGDGSHKLAVFADDLLFRTQPFISLPSVLLEFEHIANLDNIKMNASKSEIQHINLSLLLRA